MTWFEKVGGDDAGTAATVNSTGAATNGESMNSNANSAAPPAPAQQDTSQIETKGNLRIQAHENPIAVVALNHNGTLLATASENVSTRRLPTHYFVVIGNTHQNFQSQDRGETWRDAERKHTNSHM